MAAQSEVYQTMSYVKVKHGERVLKLRPETLTVSNLSLVFKLDAHLGVYIYSEEEGEIVLPSEAGLFQVGDFGKTYIVNGEPARPSSSISSLGIPISYQQPRSKPNPPPATLERPTFNFKTNKSQGWKKAFVVIEIKSSGAVSDKFQVYLQLKEETASVQAISDMLKQQLGFEVCLLDAKHLPIMAGETTKGSQFWRSSRKILIAKRNEMSNLKRNKKKRTRTGDIFERLRRMVSDDSDDDDFLETRPVAASSSTEQQHSTANAGRSTSDKEAARVLKSIFRCSICFNTVHLPAAACANCHAVMGCIPCVEQWHASSANASQCPLCRTSVSYVVVPVIREICNLLGTPIPDNGNNGEDADPVSDTDTLPYGVGDGDEDDLRPMLS